MRAIDDSTLERLWIEIKAKSPQLEQDPQRIAANADRIFKQIPTTLDIKVGSDSGNAGAEITRLTQTLDGLIAKRFFLAPSERR